MTTEIRLTHISDLVLKYIDMHEQISVANILKEINHQSEFFTDEDELMEVCFFLIRLGTIEKVPLSEQK